MKQSRLMSLVEAVANVVVGAGLVCHARSIIF